MNDDFINEDEDNYCNPVWETLTAFHRVYNFLGEGSVKYQGNNISYDGNNYTHVSTILLHQCLGLLGMNRTTEELAYIFNDE